MSSSVLVVGHVCWDIRHGEWEIGGPPMYMYPVLKHFFDEVHLLTSCRDSYPLPDYDWTCRTESEEDTVFVYREGTVDDRDLVLQTRASEIEIPDDLRNYDALIISAVAEELPVESVTRVRGKLRVIDMQSLVRRVDKGGRVEVVKDRHRDLALSHFDFVKASEIESSESGIVEGNLLLTSERGVKYISAQSTVTYPSKRVQRVVDPTGSGDVFLAAFTGCYSVTGDVEKAIDLGQEAAAINVQYPGVPPEEAFDPIPDILARYR